MSACIAPAAAVLETGRLVLRMPAAADAPAFQQMKEANDGSSRGTSWRGFAALLGHWMIRGFGPYSVIARDGDRFAGTVGLWQPDGWPEIELGWHLAPAAQGRGYATEAARAVRRHAAATLGARRLVSYIAAGNRRSQAVARRLGAVHEGAVTLDFGLGGRHAEEVWRHPDPEAAA
ncbi:GNAT family N-acetyltransferase [Paralimibaculum aggregatum]|uniref:GNAT family N-acetyltransferase n=1 Tax=Paralimibaculum aggregatum TaxID=3036245 RepID=A0ABQ6LTR3_9RHOB|nr:GNAT family N-acetyltransferase [Limibaculum sp. NKW23]GMG85475.1 GNAT family N-acetyltransferase [Limibaculum sp. NKW23]